MISRPVAGAAVLMALAASVAPAQEAARLPRPFAVAAKLPDAVRLVEPSQVHIDGWLGARIDANAHQRLLNVDTEPLLAGYKQKPGSHPWIGEHVGKWLHAATLAWAYTGDPKLKAKLDDVVAQLVATQEPDGYLGTYVPDQRFGLYRGADWDVWSHKYNLIGLLTYYQYTSSEPALAACRRMGDLLIATFPAKRSIIAAGTHVGMAATSVLEPVVLLYRLTGDDRYLDFARYIVKAYDEPEGSKILATLREGKGVNETANAKAYEMMSNLVGVCELARATGDRDLLAPVVHAWDDIVANRLYLTGSASAGEHFQKDHELPNTVGAHLGETCVTTTWIQLNLQLLRLRGDAKYAEELERTFYNHLAAAQHPEGNDWCYYTALEGAKQYDQGITCCHSSGPRGMALVPCAAYTMNSGFGNPAIGVNTLETSRATIDADGQSVTLEQQSGFPREGRSVLTLRMQRPAKITLVMRVPSWAWPLGVQAGETQKNLKTQGTAWVVLDSREWHDGDRVELTYSLPSRLVTGTYGNAGKAALTYGPFVLAYDQKRNPEGPSPGTIQFADEKPSSRLVPGPSLALEVPLRSARSPKPFKALLVPFADAGDTGGTYRVWLRAPGAAAPATSSLLIDGQESRSRPGNLNGSIVDDDPDTPVVTFDAKPADRDWFAVALPAPVEIGRIEFLHGRTFHDGGWFDASAGKPEIQVQREKGGPWETVGRLATYPDTTATDSRGLKPGQVFSLLLPEPARVVAVRVLGVPAHGDNPAQAFSSCGELRALAK